MLSQIAAKKRERVEYQKQNRPLVEIKKQLRNAGPLRPFYEALSAPGISLIAEVKKASPSKGNFALNDPVDVLAVQYEKGGARAISVLTEEDYFCGSSEDLAAVRHAVSLPVLRKDFVIDAYQLYESRLMCADAVLLIAGFLPEKQLQEFLGICSELDLAALVETHNEEDIKMAVRSGANIIGINNRDLNTFETDVKHTVRLAGFLPAETLLVSESGIRTAADVQLLAEAGADAILVGETLVRAASREKAIREKAIRELTGGRSNGKN